MDIQETDWSILKIDKFTNTNDFNHMKLGFGVFNIQLKDSQKQIHNLSATAIASGLTNNEGIVKGKTTNSDAGAAIAERAIKDVLKIFNKIKISSAPTPLFWVDNPLMHNRFFDDKWIGREPNLKGLQSCSLNLFSIKAKVNKRVSFEGSIDIYSFIAGHQFVPSFTAYYFVVMTMEFPFGDFITAIRNFFDQKDSEKNEFSFVQYYCPFIGLDSSTAWDSAKGYGLDLGRAILKNERKESQREKELIRKFGKLIPSAAWRPIGKYNK